MRPRPDEPNSFCYLCRMCSALLSNMLTMRSHRSRWADIRCRTSAGEAVCSSSSSVRSSCISSILPRMLLSRHAHHGAICLSPMGIPMFRCRIWRPRLDGRRSPAPPRPTPIEPSRRPGRRRLRRVRTPPRRSSDAYVYASDSGSEHRYQPSIPRASDAELRLRRSDSGGGRAATRRVLNQAGQCTGRTPHPSRRQRRRSSLPSRSDPERVRPAGTHYYDRDLWRASARRHLRAFHGVITCSCPASSRGASP